MQQETSTRENGRRSSLALLGVEVGGMIAAERVVELPVGSIRRNPEQPRGEFSPESLQELADSIKAHGLQNPVVVRELPPAADAVNTEAPAYELISGERRWRAHTLAGLPTIKSIIRKIVDGEMLKLAIVENIHREDLSLLDRANSFCKFKEQYHKGRVDSAVVELKISRATGFYYDRIGRATPAHKDLIVKKGLDVRTTNALLSLVDKVAKESPAKVESLEKTLSEGELTAETLTRLKEEYFPPAADKTPKAQSATKDKAPAAWGYWTDDKSFGIKIAIKKSEELSVKQRAYYTGQVQKFMKEMGAKKVIIEF